MTLFSFTDGLFNGGCSHLEFGQCQAGPCLYAKLKADQLLTSAPDTYEQNGAIQIELNIQFNLKFCFHFGPASAAPRSWREPPIVSLICLVLVMLSLEMCVIPLSVCGTMGLQQPAVRPTCHILSDDEAR